MGKFFLRPSVQYVQEYQLQIAVSQYFCAGKWVSIKNDVKMQRMICHEPDQQKHTKPVSSKFL